MNEQNQKQAEQAQKGDIAATELNEDQLDKVAGGGHVKVFDGLTGAERRF
ncbi:MAG: hypothetical protein AB7K24_06075 [Gemmataceae bacterium]